jgi:hypothetical protein
MPEPTVDVNVPRFNQAVVAVLTAVAFVAQLRWLVALTFVVLAVSWLGGPRFAPLTRIYLGLIRPRLNQPVEYEPAAPPRFAQLVGSVTLGLATVFLYGGAETVGWALTLLVTALAGLAATTRVCVGCILYEKVVAR